MSLIWRYHLKIAKITKDDRRKERKPLKLSSVQLLLWILRKTTHATHACNNPLAMQNGLPHNMIFFLD